jgi:RNA recognition motif-containing protein
MTSIFVGNLSYRATANDVRHAFLRFGRVLNVTIVKDDETGDSRGFAFVDMAVDKEAATAIRQLSHCQFRGQPITVHKSTFNGGRSCPGNG